MYRSKAVGYEDQDDFLNAVARIETNESALSVHEALVSIEQHLKKATPFENGPRTIDLDLLLYGDKIIDEPGLSVPHPRMHQRRFVLEPLLELIDAGSVHPLTKKSWYALLDELPGQILTKIPVIIL